MHINVKISIFSQSGSRLQIIGRKWRKEKQENIELALPKGRFKMTTKNWLTWDLKNMLACGWWTLLITKQNIFGRKMFFKAKTAFKILFWKGHDNHGWNIKEEHTFTEKRLFGTTCTQTHLSTHFEGNILTGKHKKATCGWRKVTWNEIKLRIVC